MNEFLNKLAQAMEVASLGETDNYKALPEWDSLTKLCVIAMVDSGYGVTLGPTEIESADTPRELWELVRSRQDEAVH